MNKDQKQSKENIKKVVKSKDLPPKSPEKPNNNNKSGFKITPWWKEIFLGLVNVILVVLTFVYLSKLPERARLAKEQRNSSGTSSKVLNLDLAKFEIESSKEKVEKMSGLFPDQKMLLNFIGEIDKLKTSGSVTYFAFASENIVKEKTGFVGYPFVLEFAGTKAQVSDGLESFNKLPYVFKSVNVAIENSGRPGVIILRYGGFLYVQESASKN